MSSSNRGGWNRYAALCALIFCALLRLSPLYAEQYPRDLLLNRAAHALLQPSPSRASLCRLAPALEAHQSPWFDAKTRVTLVKRIQKSADPLLAAQGEWLASLAARDQLNRLGQAQAAQALGLYQRSWFTPRPLNEVLYEEGEADWIQVESQSGLFLGEWASRPGPVTFLFPRSGPAGLFTLRLAHRGGVRLAINGQLLPTPPARSKLWIDQHSVSLRLPAGESWVMIELEGTNGQLALRWTDLKGHPRAAEKRAPSWRRPPHAPDEMMHPRTARDLLREQISHFRSGAPTSSCLIDGFASLAQLSDLPSEERMQPILRAIEGWSQHQSARRLRPLIKLSLREKRQLLWTSHEIPITPSRRALE
ncbi:MAG: hypothetical protein VYD19_08835, partial [Myxococcota bacterium]|nr:hypothetical protein [Myxococcota bacterium]